MPGPGPFTIVGKNGRTVGVYFNRDKGEGQNIDLWGKRIMPSGRAIAFHVELSPEQALAVALAIIEKVEYLNAAQSRPEGDKDARY